MNNRFRLIIITIFYFTCSFIIPETAVNAGAVYCLETKKELVAYLKDSISNNIDGAQSAWNLPHKFQSCWNSTVFDNRAQNESGLMLMNAVSNPDINSNLRRACYLILDVVAPDNVYHDSIRFLNANSAKLETEYKLLLLSSIFKMRTKTIVRRNVKYVDDEINNVITVNRALFDERSSALNGLIHALTIKYPLEYPKAKEELIDVNLFELSRKYQFGMGLFDFYDPRAFEDDEKYYNYLGNRSKTSARMFTALKKHLELEFKSEWLQKLEAPELRILRNAIFASYGYKFSNQNIQKYFYDDNNLIYICRNGRCGKPEISFEDKFLTEIDKKNIALIKEIEKTRV